eukprot:Rmarinus@m.17139
MDSNTVEEGEKALLQAGEQAKLICKVLNEEERWAACGCVYMCTMSVLQTQFGHDSIPEFALKWAVSFNTHVMKDMKLPTRSQSALHEVHSKPSSEEYAQVVSAQSHAYPEILDKLDISIRWAVLIRILQLEVRDKNYDARCRATLRHVAKNMMVPWAKFEEAESMTTQAILKAAQDEKAAADTKKGNSKYRGLKIGMAAVGGGVAMALTAGLAAPAVAAAFAVMGASAAITAAATAPAMLAAAFGGVGAGLAGYKMHHRIGDVKEFSFEHVDGTEGVVLVICVSGWLSSKSAKEMEAEIAKQIKLQQEAEEGSSHAGEENGKDAKDELKTADDFMSALRGYVDDSADTPADEPDRHHTGHPDETPRSSFASSSGASEASSSGIMSFFSSKDKEKAKASDEHASEKKKKSSIFSSLDKKWRHVKPGSSDHASARTTSPVSTIVTGPADATCRPSDTHVRNESSADEPSGSAQEAASGPGSRRSLRRTMSAEEKAEVVGQVEASGDAALERLAEADPESDLSDQENEGEGSGSRSQNQKPGEDKAAKKARKARKIFINQWQPCVTRYSGSSNPNSASNSVSDAPGSQPHSHGGGPQQNALGSAGNGGSTETPVQAEASPGALLASGRLASRSNRFLLEWHVLRWESASLLALGDAIYNMAMNSVKGYVGKKMALSVLGQAAMAALATPLLLIQSADVIDNPWSVVADRARKVGLIMADALAERVQGNRPVVLVGYGNGARAIFYCLEALGKREDGKGSGIVESAFLFGANVVGSPERFKTARRACAHRLVNGYCHNDWLLSYLGRVADVRVSYAGLGPVACAGVENVDLSALVHGHIYYASSLPQLMEHVDVLGERARRV